MLSLVLIIFVIFVIVASVDGKVGFGFKSDRMAAALEFNNKASVALGSPTPAMSELPASLQVDKHIIKPHSSPIIASTAIAKEVMEVMTDTIKDLCLVADSSIDASEFHLEPDAQRQLPRQILHTPTMQPRKIRGK